MNSTRLTILAIVILPVLVIVGLWFFINEKGTQSRLAEIDCTKLLGTDFELQGTRLLLSRDETCEVLRMVAAMEPNGAPNHNEEGDPWHYFGRMRIRPSDDVWFLVFMARRSDNFKPVFSLRHRKGHGWSVVGQFDAEPILTKLGVLGRIDTAKLRSDSSLVPTDQSTAM